MNENKLLGLWINKVLLNHFKDQQAENADKLFVKVSGLTTKNVHAVLNEFRSNLEVFKKYYDPIIRTVTPISGFEEFAYRDFETSTWLRNNTKVGQSLILIINERTPEAQSLENLFTIDEAYLLSQSSLKSLYNLMSENGFIAPDEIKHVQKFMDMFTSIAEPQLRNVLTFFVQLLIDPNPSVINKIQRNLPYLNLFMDSKLVIDKKEKSRLKRNFDLANLNIRENDQEKILNNLYTFLEEEEKSNYPDEVWESKSVDELTTEVIEFINHNSLSLLFYDFEFVSKVFNFKGPKPNLSEDIKEVLKNNEDSLDKNEIEKFEQGFDEVLNGQDPDLIQEFIDEFEEVLNQKPGLVKKLNRMVDKLRNPSEYEDLTYALQREIYNFIEEQQGNPEVINSKFDLEILTSKSKEHITELLNFYVKNIQNVLSFITFNQDSIPVSDDAVKETDIVFEIKHHINGEVQNKKKFKITSFNDLELYSFFEKVEKDIIPYFQNYAENEIVNINVLDYIKEHVKPYITSQEPGIKENLEMLETYLINYLGRIKSAKLNGLFSLDSNELESELTELLNNIYTSTVVTQNIYQNLNMIGAMDYFEEKKEITSVPITRTLTLLNPVRLISYIKRYEEVNKNVFNWMSYAAEGKLEIQKPEEYLEFIHSQTMSLAPRYFSNYGANSFLVENHEVLGEGTFVINTKPQSSSDYLANELAEELIKTTKSYFEVYPYAKDGMDILMLYCESAEVIKKSVESLFNKTGLKKLRLTIHSEHAAKMHNQLNKWLEQKEDFNKPDSESKFPKLELNVISGSKPNEIFSHIDKHMSDHDLVVLADYFSQANQVNFRLERIRPETTTSWFETIHQEPLKNDEAVKRMSYVSEQLPLVLQHFYQMQYIIQSLAMPQQDELNVLKNIISINDLNHSSLIDYMHKKFNWTMILDKYLDKTLLTKTSAQANIIQYKPKAGKNKQFKLIVSSSKYIRKLSEETSDYAYYDRLHRKLASILKNNNISREVIIEGVNKVKEISGAMVLKVIGRGKYAHEMLATYLSTSRRTVQNATKLQIWASCDDLPWFANNKRRPDLVLTTISNDDGKLYIDFELVELKFVNHNIFEKERFDALKQVKSGMSLYRDLFSFSNQNMDAEFWKRELLLYLIERSSYSPDHVNLLKTVQNTSLKDIVVNVEGSVDVYCYTSNLTEYNFEKLDEGMYLDKLDSNINNFIFTRAYILNELGANELEQPIYEELNVLDNEEESLQEEFGFKLAEDEDFSGEVPSDNEQDNENNQNDKNRVDTQKTDKIDRDNELGQDGTSDSANTNDSMDSSASEETDQTDDDSTEVIKVPKDNVVQENFPEVIALTGLELTYKENDNDATQLRDQYIRKLKNNFNQNGIHLNVKDAIIGSSVIRLELDLPADLPVNKVLNRSKDIQLWLGLSREPHLFINKGMKVDIVREEPDTIYFEKFMALTRKQLSDKITETNLIAPLGLDPLNNVVYMDFSNSMTPHLLTGGTTGSGKSVTLNSIILGMMSIYSPEQVQFLFIDPKKVEFTIYQNRIHTSAVVTDLGAVVEILTNMIDEMENRYSMFASVGATNLDEYIEITEERIHRIVIVFDEFADFMTQDPEMKKQVENSILRLGQKARAAGIHLIICTQNPKADIINTNIRNNLGARLALRAADATASNIILDEAGAEKLAGKGDFLAKLYGNIERGKSPFLTPKVRAALLKYFEVSEDVK